LATTTTTFLGPIGPTTTTAYLPFTLITTNPNPVVRGNIENVTITVSMNGPNGTRIPGAIIHGAIVSPTNVELNFSGLTDSLGNFSYKMLISRDATLGQYIVNVQTIAPANTHDNTPLEISTQNFIVVVAK
jgi:hypothetical protein